MSLLGIGFFTSVMAASITLAWDSNTEDDLAGYRVYWGTQSSDYDRSEFVGNVTRFEIKELESGLLYYFSVTALDWWGNESTLSVEVQGAAGEGFPENYKLMLYPSVPNPFSANGACLPSYGQGSDSGGNSETRIKYSVPERTEVQLQIINTLGQKVRTLYEGTQNAGLYQRTWDGTDDNGQVLASGVYFCTLVLPNTQISKPLTFLH